MELRQRSYRWLWISIGLLVVALAAIPALRAADFFWGRAAIDPATTGPISGVWPALPTWPGKFVISPQDPEHREVVEWLNSVADRGKRRFGKPTSFTLASNTFEAHVTSRTVYLIVYGPVNHEIILEREPTDDEFLESLRVRMNAPAALNVPHDKPGAPSPNAPESPRPLPIQAPASPDVELTDQESNLARELRARDSASMNRLASLYMAALEKFTASGGAYPAATTTAEEIDHRLALLDAAKQAHEKLMARASSVAERTRRELQASSVRPEAVEAIAKQRESAATPGLELHRLESQIMDMTRERLELLKTNIGHWRVDAKTHLVLLETFQKKERFMELVDWVERLLADQQRMIESHGKR